MSSINDKQNKAVPIPDEVMRKIFESVSEGIMITDCRKRICHVNPAFEFVTGYTREEVIGTAPTILQSGMHGPHFYREMWEQILAEGSWQGEIWNRRKTGDVYPEWLTISEVRDEAGNVTNYCGIFSDLSERHRVETQLEQTIAMDSLTSVSNRHNYMERMDTLLATSSALSQQVQHAVYVIDIDRFKQFNDTFGHVNGDFILATIANRLKGLIKNKDIIARYGGDEFVITLTSVADAEEARIFGDKVLDAIRQPMNVAGAEVFLNASVGVSLYPYDGTTTEKLLHNADKAMTYIKTTGRGGYEFILTI